MGSFRGCWDAGDYFGLLRKVLFVLVMLCGVIAPSGAHSPIQRTLALVKPDAVLSGNAANIKADIEAAGFRIVSERELQLSPEFVKRFYAEHAGRHFFEGLVEFMSSGRTLALILERQDAVAAWRSLMGPTDSAVARRTAPDSMRAKYGTDGQRNAVHGSETVDRAREEIRMVFEDFTDDASNGQITNVLVGTSALAAAIYGLRIVALSWPVRNKLGSKQR